MDISSRLTTFLPQNSALLTTLSQTDYAHPALVQQQTYITDLTQSLQTASSQIASLERRTAIEKSEHEAYHNSRMKRLAYHMGGSKGRSKFAARASKEEREYYEALEAEGQAKDRVAALQSTLADARDKLAQFERDARRHDDAQAELDGLYDMLFAGPTPQFPAEDQQETKYAAARDEQRDAQQRFLQARQAGALLLQAQSCMVQALEHVESALFHSGVDMWAGGGMFSDMKERDALSAAKSQVVQVNGLVEQARRYDADIRPLGPVEVADGNLFGDVVFDNFFSDYDFDKKIRATKEQLLVAQTELRTRIQATKTREGQRQVAFTQAGERLREARMDLQTVRQEAFQRLAADQPPPPYSRS